jgi:DNA modification methylase
MTVRILQGDCREVLRTLPDESVHCVVTSPPYFGLRDYGVDGQIGLEETPSAFVAEMVAVFREMRRVLRKDGTLWLNLGDSYCSTPPGTKRPGASEKSTLAGIKSERYRQTLDAGTGTKRDTSRLPGLKPKDLIGIPWRVAFALQADGWFLRSDIIWHKPNPMPESITDRPTSAHEHVFLLSKSERYFYDHAAVKEPVVAGDRGSSFIDPRDLARHSNRGRCRPAIADDRKDLPNDTYSRHRSAIEGGQSLQTAPDGMRNLRNVWTVATAPFSEAHFATFPPALIEPCIKAGCAAGGTVLDPFGGVGTTGLVAQRLGRDALLIELNPEYAAMAERRIAADRAGPVERDRIRHGHKPADHGPLFADPAPGAAA